MVGLLSSFSASGSRAGGTVVWGGVGIGVLLCGLLTWLQSCGEEEQGEFVMVCQSDSSSSLVSGILMLRSSASLVCLRCRNIFASPAMRGSVSLEEQRAFFGVGFTA